jgi:hypothetical protein
VFKIPLRLPHKSIFFTRDAQIPGPWSPTQQNVVEWCLIFCTHFFIKTQVDAPISQIYFWLKLYMFRTVPLSTDCLQAVYKLSTSCLQTRMTYTIAGCTVNNSWWWMEELSETCRVSFQNTFEKLVLLFGFVIKTFVMMHGHVNVRLNVKFWTQTLTFFFFNLFFSSVSCTKLKAPENSEVLMSLLGCGSSVWNLFLVTPSGFQILSVASRFLENL